MDEELDLTPEEAAAEKKSRFGGRPTNFMKLRNLVIYKDLSDDELQALIEKKQEQEREFDLKELFDNPKELNQAKSILDKYLTEYTIESASDKNILKDIVYLEMMNFRMKKKLNEAYKKNGDIPGSYQTSLQENMDAIIDLKKNLGLIRGEEGEDDTYKKFQLMRKRFLLWQSENQASFALKCAHCQNMLNVFLKESHYDIKKHPYFEDRYFLNLTVLKLYLSKRIDKQEFADIMGCSTDYADFILELSQTNPKVKLLKESLAVSSTLTQESVPVLEPQVPSGTVNVGSKDPTTLEGQDHTAVGGAVPSTASFDKKTEEIEK